MYGLPAGNKETILNFRRKIAKKSFGLANGAIIGCILLPQLKFRNIRTNAADTVNHPPVGGKYIATDRKKSEFCRRSTKSHVGTILVTPLEKYNGSGSTFA